jgi:hypothetical protein
MRSRDNKARILKLKARTGSLPESTPAQCGTRLRLGNYVADIIPDRRSRPPIHHWIVQRVDSPKILHLGQEPTLAEALERSHHCLEELVRQHGSKGSAIHEFATASALKSRPTAPRSPARAPSSGLRRPSSRRSIGSVPGRSE